jgi:drug/metabolite transporter (DMT)-like permease
MQVASAAVDVDAQLRRGRWCLVLAALAWSSAGVLQRGLSVDLPTQIGGRALFAALTLLAYVTAVERGRPLRGFVAIGRNGLAIAPLLSIASASFIAALTHTSVANVLLMQALAPIMAAALAGIVLHEPVTRQTLAAMALALVGVSVMVGLPAHASALGEGLAFLSSLCFAAVIVLARRGRRVSMAPATCLSQWLLVVCFLPFAHTAQIGRNDLLLLALLGVGQLGLGLILLTAGARLIPAAEVALISLLEVVLGPFWVWLSRSETPDAATFVGGAVVLLAVLVQFKPRGTRGATPRTN